MEVDELKKPVLAADRAHLGHAREISGHVGVANRHP